MKKRIINILLVLCLSLSFASCTKSQAVLDFEAASTVLQEKNKELDDTVAALQTVLDSDDSPLLPITKENAKNLILEAYSVKYLVPEMAKKDEEIIKQTEEMNSIDYSDIIAELNSAKETLQKSIEQKKLVMNPSEEYVLTRLSRVENVTEIAAVTEDHDPNGHLHKPGGYTSAIIFECDLVKEPMLFDDLIDNGTVAGGTIEVFATEEDANKRNDYLASFDGSVLDSGSHEVIGTIVIRTSRHLTATNQRLMTDRIIEALTSPQ